MAGSLVLTALAAVLPVAAEYAHRQGMRGLKWAAWLAVPVALAFVFTVSIQRTGTATDNDETARKQHAEAISIARAEQREAENQLVTDKALVNKNCVESKWGPICDKAKAAQAATESKLASARKALRSHGVEVDDSMAKRLVAYLPFLTKEAVQLYQPLLLPLGLAVVGSLLIAIGARGRGTKNASSNPAQPANEIVIPTPPKPRLVASNPTTPVGNVKRILTDNLEAADGERVELADLATRYRAECRAQGRRSVNQDEFTTEVIAFCRAIGIKRKAVGDHVFLLNVRLVVPATAVHYMSLPAIFCIDAAISKIRNARKKRHARA